MERTEVITGNRQDHGWSIALILLCLGIVVYGCFFLRNTPGDFLFLLGLYPSLALPVWAVFYAVFGRKKGRKRAIISFLAIFCSLLVSGLIGYSVQKVDAIRHVTALFQKNFSAATGFADHSRHSMSPSEQASLEELAKYKKAVRSRGTSLRNEYEAELNAIGWETVVDPVKISQGRDLEKSGLTISSAKYLVDKFRQRSSDLFDEIREDIDGMNLSESEKQMVREGFDRGIAKARARMSATWDYEARIIGEIGSIFKLLSEKRGAWVLQDDQILFHDKTDQNVFDRHVESIQELAEKQETMRREDVETFNRNLQRLKN